MAGIGAAEEVHFGSLMLDRSDSRTRREAATYPAVSGMNNWEEHLCDYFTRGRTGAGFIGIYPSVILSLRGCGRSTGGELTGRGGCGWGVCGVGDFG